MRIPAVKNRTFKSIYSTVLAIICTFSLFLTGCGQTAAQSGETAAATGDREESGEQTADTPETAENAADISEPENTDSPADTDAPESIDWTALITQEHSLYETVRGRQISETLEEDYTVIEEEQALADGKTLLTLRMDLSNTYLDEIVAGFNRQSADYFVRLERESGDADRVLTEITAGRGPDILSGEVFPITESLLRKGVFVDLAPGLDALGITDEEYFPSFRELRVGDGIYGIRTLIDVDGRWIRGEVLGEGQRPDIGTLVEKLYTYPDQEAVWTAYAQPEAILEYLLCGSEDLWGMIDWENGTCDFSGELFARMLEIARRYADPEGRTIDLEDRWLTDYYHPMFEPREKLENEGKVILNFPFDDGYHPARFRLGDTIMLNANSKHLEGAWEFLKYLLSQEGQAYAAGPYTLVASREMSISAYAYYLQQAEEKNLVGTSEITPKTVGELFAFTEQSRPIPLRTKEILAIIYEESQGFCNGDKPLEEVRDVIQRRVQLYVSENM